MKLPRTSLEVDVPDGSEFGTVPKLRKGRGSYGVMGDSPRRHEDEGCVLRVWFLLKTGRSNGRENTVQENFLWKLLTCLIYLTGVHPDVHYRVQRIIILNHRLDKPTFTGDTDDDGVGGRGNPDGYFRDR